MHALSTTNADPQLDVTPRPRGPQLGRQSGGRRLHLGGGLAGLLLLLTVAVVRGRDDHLVGLDLWVHHGAPAALTVIPRNLVAVVVDLGLRGATGGIALAYAGWLSRRTRSWRPLLVTAGALLTLNVVVGAFKLVLGRSSPYQGGPWVFVGGTEFPSGHASNAVLTWGTVLWLQRRFDAGRLSAAAGRAALVAVAGAVGIGTLLLDTHWLSDVLAGWTVGTLLLLALPLSDHVGRQDRPAPAVRRCHDQPCPLPHEAPAGHRRLVEASTPAILQGGPGNRERAAWVHERARPERLPRKHATKTSTPPVVRTARAPEGARGCRCGAAARGGAAGR